MIAVEALFFWGGKALRYEVQYFLIKLLKHTKQVQTSLPGCVDGISIAHALNHKMLDMQMSRATRFVGCAASKSFALIVPKWAGAKRNCLPRWVAQGCLEVSIQHQEEERACSVGIVVPRAKHLLSADVSGKLWKKSISITTRIDYLCDWQALR